MKRTSDHDNLCAVVKTVVVVPVGDKCGVVVCVVQEGRTINLDLSESSPKADRRNFELWPVADFVIHTSKAIQTEKPFVNDSISEGSSWSQLVKAEKQIRGIAFCFLFAWTK